MRKTRGRFLFLLMGLVMGLLAGALLAPNVLRKSKFGTAPQSRSEQEQAQRSSRGQEMMDAISSVFEQAASNVASSCVAIIAEQDVGAQKRKISSLGSGVIVSADGTILTNNHVVSKAERLYVSLKGRLAYPATIIGTDPETDLAVIKIEASDLPAASLGDSDEVKVGQWVIAVGNPLQMMHTVTAGIISAKGRSLAGLAESEDFIQTDASINPGNSGGALADLKGDVIGINTAISSPSGGSIGIGFAIPINKARQVMKAIIGGGNSTRR